MLPSFVLLLFYGGILVRGEGLEYGGYAAKQ